MKHKNVRRHKPYFAVMNWDRIEEVEDDIRERGSGGEMFLLKEWLRNSDTIITKDKSLVISQNAKKAAGWEVPSLWTERYILYMFMMLLKTIQRCVSCSL